MSSGRHTRTGQRSEAGTTVHITQVAPEEVNEVAEPPVKVPVMFIHGLWLHASSWQPWVEYFRQAGYDALAPGWPDFPDSIEETRKYPAFMIDQSIEEVEDHYATLIRRLTVKPVIIGHSFGGLIAQKLLDRDLAMAVVSIDPAPIKGVLPLPFAQLRSALPVLRNPLNAHKVISLKPHEFRYAFANQLTETEAAQLYYEWTIPAPGRPIWQVAFANVNPKAENKVNVRKDRAPLLLMAGKHDHTVPSKITRIVQRLYSKSPAVTDLKEWTGRGHSLVIDKGWQELADYALEWLRRQHVR